MKVREKKAREQLDPSRLLDLYRQMRLIRVFEERAAEQYMLGKIRGFLHLYIGEEAIAVGSISVLEPRDYIATHYRDHGHALARGMEPKTVMAELFGKATGCSRGKGGSMHLFDASRNFMGGYAIVGGHLPIAVGLALAAKQRGEDRVTLVFLGDGALNGGEFHESMNLAAVWKLPVLFLCENNLYGMGSHVEETLALAKAIYKVADAYNMPGRQVDGMEVLAVREATQEAVDWIRRGNGPSFLEARTYRFRGHSMADPMDYRQKAEEEEWRLRDPLVTFRRHILEERISTPQEVGAVEKEVERQVEEAIAFADQSPDPPLESLYQDVYAEQG